MFVEELERFEQAMRLYINVRKIKEFFGKGVDTDGSQILSLHEGNRNRYEYLRNSSELNLPIWCHSRGTGEGVKDGVSTASKRLAYSHSYGVYS